MKTNSFEFVEDGHLYLLDGVIVPSVSEIIKSVFPDLYKGIPDRILNKAADYGKKLHSVFESVVLNDIEWKGSINEVIDNSTKNPYIRESAKSFAKAWSDIGATVDNVEEVNFYKNGKIAFGGTLDIIDIFGNIYDIKSTETLHIDSKNDEKVLAYDAPLNFQISCYYLQKGTYKKYGYVIWAPKGKACKIIKVKTWPKKKLIKTLSDYFKSKENK